ARSSRSRLQSLCRSALLGRFRCLRRFRLGRRSFAGFRLFGSGAHRAARTSGPAWALAFLALGTLLVLAVGGWLHALRLDWPRRGFLDHRLRAKAVGMKMRLRLLALVGLPDIALGAVLVVALR